MDLTTRMLGEHLGAIRCTYADLDRASQQLTIRHNWAAPGVPSVVGSYPANRFGPRVAEDLKAGRSLVVRDVDRELLPGQGAAMFSSLGVKAIVCCPQVRHGRIVAMVGVHHEAAAGHTLHVQVEAEMVWLEGDLTRLTQVLTNVLHNAAQYTPPGDGSS